MTFPSDGAFSDGGTCRAATRLGFFITPERIALLEQIAGTWLGTPFHAHASIRGRGCSCQTLPEAIYRECGFLPAGIQIPTGSLKHFRTAHESLIAAHIDKYLGNCLIPVWNIAKVEPQLCEILPGDLLLHYFPRCEHAGIALSDGRFIHAGIEGVTISRRDDATYSQHLARVWRPVYVAAGFQPASDRGFQPRVP